MDKTRILVAVDFTESSRLALEEAIRLALQLGAELDLAHVSVPYPPPGETAASSLGALGIDLDGDKQRLLALCDGARTRGLTVRGHAAVGAVVFGLLDMIARFEPNMVIVGSEGKGAIRRALMGSVAEGLCRRSPVPVLVVPSPRRRQVAAKAAWSCGGCGHILGAIESTSICAGCKAHAPTWNSAPMSSEPIDADQPSVGEIERETVASSQRNDPAGLFSTSPAGANGYDINPELRVRY